MNSPPTVNLRCAVGRHKTRQLFDDGQQILKNFSRHKCMNLAAALSYYTIFSIGPFLTIIIAFAALFFGREAVTQHVFGQIGTLIGTSGAETIQGVIDKTSHLQASRWAAALGIVVLFFGATGVFMQIQDALNIIWEAKLRPKEKGWVKVLKNRFLSFGLILGLGFLLLVSLGVNAAMSVVSQGLAFYFESFLAAFVQIIDVLFSVLATTALFALIFKFLPDVKMRWRDVWLGSLLTASLFALGRLAIGFYLTKNTMISAYGTAASVIILILWINYSALILFFGAEVTAFYTQKRPLK